MDAVESKNFNLIDFEQYATSKYYLSRGASGNVYGPIPYNDIHVAIKETMFADGKVTDEFKKDIEAKKGIWTSLEHKNLVKIHLVQLSKLPKVMFSAMEFAAGGSLCKMLRSLESGKNMPIHVVTDWAKQIAEGMLYLHQKNIVHRDLKSANILLMEPFDIRNPYVITTLKIADFDDIKKHDHTTTMSGLVGTFAYMAPEVLRYQQFSKTSDIWSYGVVIWEMLSGDIPYKGLKPAAIIHRSQTGELSTLPVSQSFPEQYKLLLNRCWESVCTKRPLFLEIFFTIQRWDDFPERYKWDPALIETIRTKAAADGNKRILGLTILDKELFVVNEESSDIEVYDSINLTFSRVMKFMETFQPWDVISCSRRKCLYILNRIAISRSNEIMRIDRNGTLEENWSTGDDCGHLSVTDESNIVLTVHNKSKLNEFLPDGQLIRVINLLLDADIGFLLHAIKLTNGHFLVSHGYCDGDEHKVCMVDAGGNVLKSYGGNGGYDIEHMFNPIHLCVDGNGFVLVADQENGGVLLLDSNLEFKREILSAKKHGLRQPRKILLDESCGRMLVADKERKQILVFQFCQ